MKIESTKVLVNAGQKRVFDFLKDSNSEKNEGILEKVYNSAKNMVVKFFVLLFGGLLDFTFEDKISEVPPNAKQIYCETKS